MEEGVGTTRALHSNREEKKGVPGHLRLGSSRRRITTNLSNWRRDDHDHDYYRHTLAINNNDVHKRYIRTYYYHRGTAISPAFTQSITCPRSQAQARVYSQFLTKAPRGRHRTSTSTSQKSPLSHSFHLLNHEHFVVADAWCLCFLTADRAVC